LCRDLSGLMEFRARSVFFCRRRHVASARAHATYAHGSSSSGLVPDHLIRARPLPTSRPVQPRNGSTLQLSGPGDNQTVIQLGTLSTLAPTTTRQLSTRHTVGFLSPAVPDSSLAQQPADLEPGIVRQPQYGNQQLANPA